MVVPQPHIPVADGPHLEQVWPALLSPRNPAALHDTERDHIWCVSPLAEESLPGGDQALGFPEPGTGPETEDSRSLRSLTKISGS